MTALQLLFGAARWSPTASSSAPSSPWSPYAAARSNRSPTQGDRAGPQVLYGLEHLPQMMAAAQFGITVCSLTLGAVAEPTVAHLLEPVFHAAPRARGR